MSVFNACKRGESEMFAHFWLYSPFMCAHDFEFLFFKIQGKGKRYF